MPTLDAFVPVIRPQAAAGFAARAGHGRGIPYAVTTALPDHDCASGPLMSGVHLAARWLYDRTATATHLTHPRRRTPGAA